MRLLKKLKHRVSNFIEKSLPPTASHRAKLIDKLRPRFIGQAYKVMADNS
ncbi:MAG: hypothetical protein ACI92S_003292 [Planctomycetaceae bacterium]|jgi:hypothetical protein